jgi:ATP-dependent DNA helicase RecQ
VLHVNGVSFLQKQRILHDVFGYGSFRPGQEEIVDRLLAGSHVLAVMPTGSGKSLCFQVPALVMGGLTIVVSPLVALMQDQVAALKLAGVAAETINSTASREDNVAIWQRVASGEVRILYLAPERLMTERMISALQRLDVRLIAVDEAHCISQWGASFRPEYDALQNLKHEFPNVPIGAFTATADDVTRRDMVAKIFGGKADVFVSGFDRPNIKLTVDAKSNSTKQVLEFLEDRKGESGIIYALSRKSVEEWAAFLKSKGFNAVPYHAGLSADVRAENQNIFMAEKGVIVCATIAFGMGIDKPDVRFVFHADLPATLDAYYQEIGRAGRDGAAADAHMIFGMQDLVMRRRFIDDDGSNDEFRKAQHKRLDALVGYCETLNCRRMSLLSYFGEASEPCGNCDVCLDPSEAVDGSLEAIKVLETVKLTGSRFGAVHLVDVLLGKVGERVTAQRHDQLHVFGLGVDRTRTQWQAIIRQMAASGFLKGDEHGGLSATAQAAGLVGGDATFTYRAEMIRERRKDRKAREAKLLPAMDPSSDALLQRLKALRMKLAKARQVPAYVIFSDKSLIDMAAKIPLTRWDFGEVHGVGEAKQEQFGEVFLREITGFVRGGI